MTKTKSDLIQTLFHHYKNMFEKFVAIVLDRVVEFFLDLAYAQL